jgi:hypothetical protein
VQDTSPFGRQRDPVPGKTRQPDMQLVLVLQRVHLDRAVGGGRVVQENAAAAAACWTALVWQDDGGFRAGIRYRGRGRGGRGYSLGGHWKEGGPRKSGGNILGATRAALRYLLPTISHTLITRGEHPQIILPFRFLLPSHAAYTSHPSLKAALCQLLPTADT